MGRPVALIALMLVTLRLAGCAPAALNMAPDRADAPWNPAVGPDGEIAAGERGPTVQPKSSYVLPSNRNLAEFPHQPPISNVAAPIRFLN